VHHPVQHPVPQRISRTEAKRTLCLLSDLPPAHEPAAAPERFASFAADFHVGLAFDLGGVVSFAEAGPACVSLDIACGVSFYSLLLPMLLLSFRPFGPLQNLRQVYADTSPWPLQLVHLLRQQLVSLHEHHFLQLARLALLPALPSHKMEMQ
jgi:hypothetical protein